MIPIGVNMANLDQALAELASGAYAEFGPMTASLFFRGEMDAASAARRYGTQHGGGFVQNAFGAWVPAGSDHLTAANPLYRFAGVDQYINALYGQPGLDAFNAGFAPFFSLSPGQVDPNIGVTEHQYLSNALSGLGDANLLALLNEQNSANQSFQDVEAAIRNAHSKEMTAGWLQAAAMVGSMVAPALMAGAGTAGGSLGSGLNLTQSAGNAFNAATGLGFAPQAGLEGLFTTAGGQGFNAAALGEGVLGSAVGAGGTGAGLSLAGAPNLGGFGLSLESALPFASGADWSWAQQAFPEGLGFQNPLQGALDAANTAYDMLGGYAKNLFGNDGAVSPAAEGHRAPTDNYDEALFGAKKKFGTSGVVMPGAGFDTFNIGNPGLYIP